MELAGALGTASAAYAALGVGTIREAMINFDELLAYQDAWRRGLLNIWARPMIRVGAELTADEALALIDGLGAASGFGDDWLRIWSAAGPCMIPVACCVPRGEGLMRYQATARRPAAAGPPGRPAGPAS